MQTKRKLSRLKGFYQKIPEKFYEKTAFILLCMMFGMIIFSGVMEFVAIYHTHILITLYVSKYYYFVGMLIFVYAIFYISSRISLCGIKRIKEIMNSEHWTVMLIFLLIWTFFSVLNAQNRELAFKGQCWRMDGFRSYLIYAGMFLCGRVISTTKSRKYIIGILVAVATLQDSLLFIKYFTGKGSYTGAFFNENHCGYFLTMAIMVLLGFISLEKKYIEK